MFEKNVKRVSNVKKSGRSQREEARERLIMAGLEIFGRLGYEAASTRMLALKADVNLAAIPYYFGGKEGLYHATVEKIIEYGKRKIFPELEKIKKRLQSGNPSREELIKMLNGLMSHYVDIVTNEETCRFAPIIMREQIQPTSAFSIFYNEMIEEEHKVCTILVARLLKLSSESPEAIMRAHAFLGQVMMFLAARTTILRRLGIKAFSKKDTKNIFRIIKSHNSAIFSSKIK